MMLLRDLLISESKLLMESFRIFNFLEKAREFEINKSPDEAGYAAIDTILNRNDLDALSFYITVVMETFSEDPKESTTEKRTEGPIYAVSISLPNTSHRALILRLIDEGTKSKENQEILRKMVDTVRILK